MKVNVLIKYVELLKYDIRHKVDNLIKVREQNKPQEKTGAPANSAFWIIVIYPPGVSL